METLRGLTHRMNFVSSEEGGWHPEDVATVALVGFLAAVTLIALI
jgi:hypothetical protein